MQEMPPEAFITADEIHYAYMLSHRWLEYDHPDRSGGQLALALPRIWHSPAHRRPAGPEPPPESGVWYDFHCLPQAPRTPSEQRQFERHIDQAVWLTLTGVPVLIFDPGMEYSTRAWCATEVLGAHRSGFSKLSTSKALLTLEFEDVLRGSRSAWDQSLKLDNGKRPGLKKLSSWFSQTKTPVSSSEATGDWEIQKRCIKAVNDVGYTLAFVKAKYPEAYERGDPELLKTVADHHSLECTHEEDVLICMRYMQMLLDKRRPERTL